MTFLWKRINLIDVCNESGDGGSARLSTSYLAEKARISDGDMDPLYSRMLAHHATVVVSLLHYTPVSPLLGPWTLAS